MRRHFRFRYKRMATPDVTESEILSQLSAPLREEVMTAMYAPSRAHPAPIRRAL